MYIRHKQFAKKITLHFSFDQSLTFYLIPCRTCSFQWIGRCLKTSTKPIFQKICSYWGFPNHLNFIQLHRTLPLICV